MRTTQMQVGRCAPTTLTLRVNDAALVQVRVHELSANSLTTAHEFGRSPTRIEATEAGVDHRIGVYFLAGEKEAA
ncbi:hypothetical protein [Pararobbsia silviterrae]|uniref:Uncharacterized protein n=1 Tax=Pararobbsia silviterrae TaxID=1792498 RepID=A0A494YEZ3_9BURK|nr:hypothetical protein [Pararobbsia silviterrae]RKP58637.1 hypothetical protein D7S86_01450 [Pararobbsia silviterrae]